MFESFCYVCRNKSLANDYIAHCINNFSQKSTLYFPEYAGFSFFENDEKGTFVRFDCNRKKIEMELLKHCSPCFIEKVLSSVQNRPLSITEICEKYFDTDKKMLLFVFSLCGYAVIVARTIMMIWTYAERVAGVPIDYGQVAHINIVP